MEINGKLFVALRLVTLVGACVGTSGLGGAAPAGGARENPLLGCWRAEDGTLVRFEAKRVTVFDRDKQLRFYVAKYKDGGKPNQVSIVKLHSPLTDEEGTFRPRIEENVLTIERAGILPKTRFHKLKVAPPEIEVKPMTLGEAKALPPEKVRAIAEEMARRAETDQEVRKDPAKAKKAWQTDRDNVAYLIGLLKKVGWIDAERFDAKTSEAAMLIAQHSGDLSLMAAILPRIEKDVKANRLFTGQVWYPLMLYRFYALQAKKPVLPSRAAQAPEEERVAVRAVEALGGQVGQEGEGEPITSVDLGDTEVTDAGLKKLKEKLKELKELRVLNLIGCERVTDAGLKELQELKGLRMLYLGGTRVTDAGLKELQERQELQELDLSDTEVTDAGLKKLKELKELRMLGLVDCERVTDAGLKEIRELKGLRKLYLGGTRVTDAGLKEIKELQALQELGLGRTRVTDAGLEEIKWLGKELRRLFLTETKVTDAGVAKLKKAFPELTVER